MKIISSLAIAMGFIPLCGFAHPTFDCIPSVTDSTGYSNGGQSGVSRNFTIDLSKTPEEGFYSERLSRSYTAKDFDGVVQFDGHFTIIADVHYGLKNILFSIQQYKERSGESKQIASAYSTTLFPNENSLMNQDIHFGLYSDRARVSMIKFNCLYVK